MRIDISELLGECVGAQVDVSLNLGFQQLDNDTDIASLEGTLSLLRIAEGVWVKGTLDVGTDLQCVRCLAPVTKTLEIEFDERFELPPIDVSNAEQVYAIDADHHIDLAPALRELVVVSTPMRVLCQTGCAGLCPTCGANLNQGACDCVVDDIDPRMASLKALLT